MIWEVRGQGGRLCLQPPISGEVLSEKQKKMSHLSKKKVWLWHSGTWAKNGGQLCSDPAREARSGLRESGANRATNSVKLVEVHRGQVVKQS